MLKIYTKAKALMATRDQGVTAAEYALILVLVAIAILVGVTALGVSINRTFTNVSTHMP